MRIEDLDFDLPPEAIAQTPAEPRDSCRLMRLPTGGGIEHAVFSDLERMLEPGDLLVFNDSKVLPARLVAAKPSGGAVELLFVRPHTHDDADSDQCWEVLVRPSRRVKPGSEVLVAGEVPLVFVEALGEGRWLVRPGADCSLTETMERYGKLPLPPYIRAYPDEPAVYQTVYARVLGSAAAPTAGLHFTTDLLDKLESAGVGSAWVTLHVGLDTFLPIRESKVEKHRIHTESFEVPVATLTELRRVRKEGGRVVAVGTTAARVLETIGQQGQLEEGRPECDTAGSTGIFIKPGYSFLVVDALLTNFHLPRSTVLALTMAFAGVERIKAAYREAVDNAYRFFSFGDAMLIEKSCLDSRGMGACLAKS